MEFEKTEQGITVNGELILIKDYALYMIMYKEKLESKADAQKIWDKLSPIYILIKYFKKEN